MIIVKIKAGLGNQLFQYAFAKRLAIANETEVWMDSKSGNENDPQGRIYGLENFCIEENLISDQDSNTIFNHGKWPRKFQRFIERRIPIFSSIYRIRLSKLLFIYEENGNFDKNIFNLKTSKNVHVNGYWASEKYFKDIEPIIRSEFRIKSKPNHENQVLIDQIESCQSVSLHVRARKPGSFQQFAILGEDYYNEAIKIINKSIPNPHYFIFSDNPIVAKKLINIPGPSTYVNANGIAKDYDDLRLMSVCKHNVIVNSTFSWWGAWLNSNPDKIVIAPREWFKDPKRNQSLKYSDLYPKQWQIL
jgi:hypothetical protein